MERVGEVVRVTQGLAIVRVPQEASDHAAIGTDVIDESLDTVGRVVDVFGPVSRPYLAVSPTDTVSPATLLGDRLYAR